MCQYALFQLWPRTLLETKSVQAYGEQQQVCPRNSGRMASSMLVVESLKNAKWRTYHIYLLYLKGGCCQQAAPSEATEKRNPVLPLSKLGESIV